MRVQGKAIRAGDTLRTHHGDAFKVSDFTGSDPHPQVYGRIQYADGEGVYHGRRPDELSWPARIEPATGYDVRDASPEASAAFVKAAIKAFRS